MPKYFPFAVCGYYIYFTGHCVVEAIHAHASDKQLTEDGSAKFWITKLGDTVVADTGRINARDIKRIQRYIKDNHTSMFDTWKDAKGLDSIEEIEYRLKNSK